MDTVNNFIFGILNLAIAPIAAHETLLKAIAFIITPPLVAFHIYMLYDSDFIQEKIVRIRDFFEGPNAPQRSLRIWKKIQAKLASKDPKHWKEAVLDADHILYHLLVSSGYVGKTVDDMLAKINPSEISNIKDLAQAHKLRDKLMRDEGFAAVFTAGETREAIAVYQKSFEEWGLLD